MSCYPSWRERFAIIAEVELSSEKGDGVLVRDINGGIRLRGMMKYGPEYGERQTRLRLQQCVCIPTPALSTLMICVVLISPLWVILRPNENLEPFIKIILECPTISSYICQALPKKRRQFRFSYRLPIHREWEPNNANLFKGPSN